VRRNLVLDLQIIKAFPLIQSIGIVDSSGIWRWLLSRCAIIAAFSILVWIRVRIVDEALLLEEVFAARVPRLVHFELLLRESVVLDVYLSLICSTICIVDVLLHHVDESDKLRAFYLLWVEVVGFRYVQVGDNLISVFVG